MTPSDISKTQSGFASAISFPPVRPLHAAILAFALTVGLLTALAPVYIPFAIILSLVILAAFVKKPEASLFLVALTAPLMSVMVTWGEWLRLEWILDRHVLLAVDFAIPFLLFSIAVGRVTGKVDPIPVIKSAIPLFLLVCYGAFTLVWVEDMPGGVTLLAHLISCVLLFYAPIALLKTEKALKAFLWIWLLVGGLFAGIAAFITLYYEFKTANLLVYTIHSHVPLVQLRVLIFENIQNRVAGLADPNRVALMMNTALMGGIVLFMTAKSRVEKIFLVPLVFFVAYTIVHTLSKGGVGSLGMTLLLFIMLHPRFKNRRLLTMALLGVAFIGLTMLMSYIDLKGGLGRFGESPVKSRGSSSMALRLMWWTGDFDALIASDWIGTGLGGVYKGWAYAQSSYFSLLADFGAFGFLIGAWFFLSYCFEMYTLLPRIRQSYFHYTAALAFVGCVLIFMIHSLVDFGYNLRIVWVWAGLAVATAKLGIRRIGELNTVSSSQT